MLPSQPIKHRDVQTAAPGLLLPDQAMPDRAASNLVDLPGVPLAFGSKLYVLRPLAEELAIEAIQQAGSLIRIKAPTRIGKTSLINYLLGTAQQRGMQPVFVDLGEAEAAVLADLDLFLRWFCGAVGQQLNLDPRFEDYWFDDAGSKLSCTTYVQEYLLRQSRGPVIIALDSVQQLVSQPTLAKHFFAMLRSWYERARVQPDWQKLRLIIAHETDFELALPTNQSPFNVGLPLGLTWFTAAQVGELIRRYELHRVGIPGADQLQPLIDLVGGQPYLLQLALRSLRSGLSLCQLLQEAPTDRGLYRAHLRYLGQALQQDAALMVGFQQVCLAPQPIGLDLQTAWRLEALGLVQLSGSKVGPSCGLYRQWAELEGYG